MFHAPGGWLDVLVALAVVGCLVCAIITCCISPSLQRGKFRFWATTLVGTAFVLAAVDQIWTRQIAPRYFMTGSVSSVRRTGGKDPTVYFTLTNASGGHLRLSASTGSDALQSGEHVRADWMIFDGDVLHYLVLDGKHIGEHFQDVVPFNAIWEPFLGLWLMWSGYRLWRKDPMGHPVRKKQPKEKDPTDVDDQSLLHLNRD
jgi:hypothetical protein